MSFLLKTVLGIAAIEAVLLLLLVVGSNSALAASLDTELAKRAETTLSLLAATASGAVLTDDLATLAELAAETVKISDVAYLRILDEDGVILAQARSANFRHDQVEESSIDLNSQDSVRPSSRVLEVDGIPYGLIQMGLSTADAVNTTDSLRRRNFIIAMSEMILVALFSFLLGRYLTGQLAKLEAASGAIASGDLGLQIPVDGSDELASTLKSFNKMSLELLCWQQEQVASEARLEGLLAGMTNGVALLGHDFSIQYSNPRGETLLEYLSPNWKRTRKLTQLGDLQLKAVVPGQVIEETIEVMIRGSSRYFAIHLTPVSGSSENQNDWILTLRDITSSRSREEHNRRRERLAVVGRLAAGMAHDFNNILGVIIGLAELNLNRADRIDEDLRLDLETILEQAQRSSGLVRQILDFSRVDESDAPTIDVGQVIKSTISMLTRTIPSSVALSFVTKTDRKLFARFDAAKLEQVIVNLVINAVDAIPDGGSVTLSAALNEGVMIRPGASDAGEERWVRIEVIDDGEGIPRKNLVDVFEPFFTTKAQGKGTGLGLAQVYGIMQQQGGDIAVDSAVGVGTTFSLFLRPAPTPKLEITRKQLEVSSASEVTSEAGLILVVEDESALRRTLCAMLEEVNYRVVTAGDGREGLRVYSQNRDAISLVMTDAVMPKMNGIDFVKALRADGCDVPVVMMSGYFSFEGVDLRELGGDLDCFLEKPVSLNRLTAVVAQMINSGRDGVDQS